ncbi:MAG: NUDIX hydrolase [Patescibacteria group bacterium]|nr:NUDIX hydrolase [Patescibacteria group bacterium]
MVLNSSLVKGEEDWTAGVFLRTPTRVVCVSEDLGRTPIYKKLPGGRKRPGEVNPAATAVREVAEETGIRISPEQLQVVAVQPRGNHTYHCFVADITEQDADNAQKYGKGGEVVHVLTLAQLKHEAVNFMPPHRKALEAKGLWPA